MSEHARPPGTRCGTRPPAPLELERSLCAESTLVAARGRALPAAVALWAAAHQAQLAAPAKAAATPGGGAFLLAEVPRCVSLHDAAKLARQALEAAVAWLGPLLASAEREAPPPSHPTQGENGARALRPEIESALASLPWAWSSRDGAAYRVDAALAPGRIARVTVTGTEGGALRVATSATLPAGSAAANAARVHFALEANARLRLARLSAAPADGAGAVRFAWDVVVPAGVPASRAVVRAIEAVVFARAETAAAVEALGEPRVAEAYLALRWRGGAR